MKATTQQYDWVAGTSGRTHEEPKPRLTKFEALAQSQGLTKSQWIGSEVLKAFAKKYRHVRYVPTFCLTAWKLRTCWDSDDINYAFVGSGTTLENVPASQLQETQK